MVRINVFASAETYTGEPFEMFGDEHLLVLTLLTLALVLLIKRFRHADEATKHKVRLGLVTALWAQEISYHVWRLATGTWTTREMLPLHLCSVAVWASGVMLLTRSYRLYEVIYFLALTGAAMALATPDVGPFGFPHYRFFQSLVSHALIGAAPLWLTFGEGFRPRWSSVGKAAGALGLYALGVYQVNKRLGSNYLFLNRKPSTPTALDLLPPWPKYVPIASAALVGVFAALYAPWAIKDSLART